MLYYLTINGQVIGPMNASQVMSYNIDHNTMVSCDGSDWKPLYSYPELMQMFNQTHRSAYEPAVTQRVLCGIMAILFGGLGVQYFILGKVAGGFITILLTLVTCGAWSVITLIQGILMLCMSDDEFNRKYRDSTSVMPLF